MRQYEVVTGSLYLTHNYPPTASGHQVFALVNVDHVLESIKSTDLQVGSWVNVIGYVTPAAAGAAKTYTVPAQAERRSKQDAAARRNVTMQAIMLWSAGAINLDEYEKALQMRKADEQR